MMSRWEHTTVYIVQRTGISGGTDFVQKLTLEEANKIADEWCTNGQNRSVRVTKKTTETITDWRKTFK